jgi:hypothetical protein
LSLAGYVGYRLSAGAALTLVGVAAGLPASGLLPAGTSVVGVAAACALASGFAPLPALALVALAGNKVEGLAVMKVVTVPLFLPVASWFTTAPWAASFAVLPTAAPAQVLWGAMQGRLAWGWFLVGATWNGVLGVLLWQRTWRRLHR